MFDLRKGVVHDVAIMFAQCLYHCNKLHVFSVCCNVWNRPGLGTPNYWLFTVPTLITVICDSLLGHELPFSDIIFFFALSDTNRQCKEESYSSMSSTVFELCQRCTDCLNLHDFFSLFLDPGHKWGGISWGNDLKFDNLFVTDPIFTKVFKWKRLIVKRGFFYCPSIANLMERVNIHNF